MELASSSLTDQNCEKLDQTSSALNQQSFAHVDYTSHPLISERRSRSVMDQTSSALNQQSFAHPLISERRSRSVMNANANSYGDAMARLQKMPNDQMYAHQRFAIEWFLTKRPRSLLLAWEPGTGKTKPIAYIAKKLNCDYVILLSPKALRTVFENALRSVGEDPARKHQSGNKRYHYIASNAANVWQQWNRVVESIDFSRFSKMRVLVVIDEAHMFSQRIANILNRIYYEDRYSAENDPTAKGAYKLYLELRALENINVIAATGTLIPNNSFELVPIHNILRGKIKDVSGRYDFAFPDKYSEFYYHFINPLSKDPPPEQIFGTRIQGMVHWFRIPRGLEGIPIPYIRRREYLELQMSEYQWRAYQSAAAKEESLESRIEKSPAIEGIPSVGGVGVYKSFTRQASNFAYPPDIALRSNKLALLSDKDVSMQNLKKYSIKIWKILSTIFDERKPTIHGIYSHFVEDFGLALFEKALRAHGWDCVNDQKAKDKKPAAKYAFMRLTGKESVEMKEWLIRKFNTEENYRTKYIRIILYSSAAGLGLSFTSVNTVHILEPQWNEAEEEQVIDRFARIGSARYLKQNERYLDVIHYLAVSVSQTTDQSIRALAKRKAEETERFLQLHAKLSISCSEQFPAENKLSAEYIKAKKLPPLRTFFSCLDCHSKLEPNIYLQIGLGLTCGANYPTPPKRGIKFEKYLLDPSNGLAFEGDVLIEDAIKLQSIWQRYLK